jgi:hypothetical protein
MLEPAQGISKTMPIDDELSQAEQLARSDEAQAPSGILQTFRKATIELIGGNPLAAIIALGDCLKGRSDAFSAENSAYLLSIVLPKVHELVLEYERLDAKSSWTPTGLSYSLTQIERRERRGARTELPALAAFCITPPGWDRQPQRTTLRS